jgi:ectoine hydroxylase-related dioxygenase (phytanoyl-CoA dioxygenase family)
MSNNNNLIIFTIILLITFILIYFYNIYYSKEYYQWNNCKLLDQEKLINTFEKNGVIIIPNVFSSEDCDKLKDIIKKKDNKYYDISPTETATKVNSEYKRRNMALPIKECRKYILSICNKLKYFVNVLIPNPILVDCAAFVTEPGCYPQKWHRDTNLNSENSITSQNYANHISMGVMLEDVDDTLGPLEAVLGTNNLFNKGLYILLKKNNLLDKYSHEYNNFDDDDCRVGLCKSLIPQLPKLDNKYKYVKCACPKGSLVLWSSCVFHRGGQNYGNKDRPVFYITLMGGDGKNPMNFESTIEFSDKKIYVKDLL